MARNRRKRGTSTARLRLRELKKEIGGFTHCLRNSRRGRLRRGGRERGTDRRTELMPLNNSDVTNGLRAAAAAVRHYICSLLARDNSVRRQIVIFSKLNYKFTTRLQSVSQLRSEGAKEGQ